MPLVIKIVLAGMMGLLAIMMSLASFVAWRSDASDKGKEQDQEDRLLSVATRVMSVIFASMALMAWILVFALVLGAFG